MGIVGAAIEKGLGILDIHSRVNCAEPIRNLDFYAVPAENPNVTIFHEKEPEAKQIFILLFKVNSPDYFSFLRLLQDLNFDIYAMLSLPHGEKLSPIHSNIPALRQQLPENPVPPNRKGAFRNKFPSLNVFTSGRFHLRLYEHADTTAVTAHIDQPLQRKSISDYPQGESLFLDLLKRVTSITP